MTVDEDKCSEVLEAYVMVLLYPWDSGAILYLLFLTLYLWLRRLLSVTIPIHWWLSMLPDYPWPAKLLATPNF